MKKVLSMLMVLMLTAVIFAGCAETSETSSTPAPAPSSDAAPQSEAPAALSGNVALTGSSSMQELMEALIEAFKEIHPGVTVEAQYPGSGQGMTAAADGTVDIGNASRELKAEEAEKLNAHVVATDGVAAIVNTANTVGDLTADQIVKIFTGEIKNWSEVGGADAPIVVIGRDEASGTRDAFQSVLGIDEPKYSQEIPSTGAVKTLVASTPDAIGYVSLEAVDESVKALSMDGVAATGGNILAGTYKLSRPFIMATNKSATLSEQAQAFLDFALGEDGKAIASDLGLVVG